MFLGKCNKIKGKHKKIQGGGGGGRGWWGGGGSRPLYFLMVSFDLVMCS